ncbi:hypothetical protein BC833DRAFT_609827 [Globomyces pollinis-pini]|nr:hypothetical protein BC833DRAFT_609827 [Globomyces pollinis-pini]
MTNIEIEQVVSQPSSYTPTKVVCLPIDASSNTRYSIQYALANLLDPKIHSINLINVLPKQTSMEQNQSRLIDYIEQQLDVVEESSVKSAYDLIIELSKQFSKHGYAVTGNFAVGDPRLVLKSYIETIAPHMVVMGSHGDNKLPGTMGSVSNFILQNSETPVVIVKEEFHATH